MTRSSLSGYHSSHLLIASYGIAVACERVDKIGGYKIMTRSSFSSYQGSRFYDNRLNDTVKVYVVEVLSRKKIDFLIVEKIVIEFFIGRLKGDRKLPLKQIKKIPYLYKFNQSIEKNISMFNCLFHD